MTHDEKLAIKQEVEQNNSLLTARMSRNYDTMAAVLNDSRPADQHLTPLQLHECMIEVPQGE